MNISKSFAMATFVVMVGSTVFAAPGSREQSATPVASSHSTARIIRSTDYSGTMAGSTVNSLHTGGNGRTRIQLQDGSLISAAEDTEVVLENGSNVQVKQGRVRATLNSDHQIQTPNAIVSGSHSDVAIDVTPTGATHVICLEGSAEVRSTDPSQSSSVSCDAGEIVVVKTGRPPRQPQLVDDRTVLLWKNITDPDETPAFTPFP